VNGTLGEMDRISAAHGLLSAAASTSRPRMGAFTSDMTKRIASRRGHAMG
jgi:hypothetical protein